MILKAAILTATATAVVAGAVTGVVVVKGGPRVVVPATAFSSAETSDRDWWFEPSGALVPKGACTPENARPGTKPVPAEDRVVVRHNSLHYRDVAGDPKPHEVGLPRPLGTTKLGSDSQLGRLKDGRLLYVEMGKRTAPFEPKPFWHDYAGYLRTTMELFTSSDCAETWDHALTVDTKDLDGGKCAVPQFTMVVDPEDEKKQIEVPHPGGFDRFEVHVDPWRGDVYVTTACRGGTAPKFVALHQYVRVLLLRIDPDLSAWHLTKGIHFNYGPPVAVMTTADGSVHLLRCDYGKRAQLVRLADRGERLISVTNVHHAKEVDGAAACSTLVNDATKEATGMDVRTEELRLAPAGPLAVRLAYHQVVSGMPRVRLYTASYLPLPKHEPCAGVRKTYLAQFAVPDAPAEVPPVPVCGPWPELSTPRVVGEGTSVVHFDLIAPDVTALSSPQAMASSMLYWMEHSPATGEREVRYRTIAADGSWSDVRTASTAPWKPRLRADLQRDADYEYGGYAFVDGRCRYALVWNQTHPKEQSQGTKAVNEGSNAARAMRAGNLYAHYAIVDDLSCTGTTASPAPVVTPKATLSTLLPKPSGVTLPPPTFSPPGTHAPATTPPPPTTQPPTSPPPTTPPPKSAVTGVTLTVEQCTPYGSGTWRCPYTAKFTFSKGSGGAFYWRVKGTLRHDCYPDQGGAVAFAKPSTYTEIKNGQTSFSAGSYMTFDKAPNPAEVNGAAAQLSVAYVEIIGTPTRSADEPFASNAVCGKP